MKILFVTTEYPPFKGGVANYYVGIVKHFPKKNKIKVLDNSEKKLLNKKFVIPWLPSFWNIYIEIKKEKADHVFVGQLLPIGTVVFFLSKILKFDYTVFIHGMDLEWAKKVKRKKMLSYKILKGAKHIITNSNHVKNLVVEFIGEEEKIKTVYPGLDVKNIHLDKKKKEEIVKKYGLENKNILLSIGRLVKRKGQDKVIEAMEKLKPKFQQNTVYLIAGAGPDEKYLKKKAEANKNIIFLGLVSDIEKDILLRLCDIFIMPARNIEGDLEGFGIVYLEAAFAGKSVIAGRSGGAGEAVLDYETGILCDPDSSDDILGAIEELLKNWGLRNELGMNGLRRVGDEFNWTKQALKFFNIVCRSQ